MATARCPRQSRNNLRSIEMKKRRGRHHSESGHEHCAHNPKHDVPHHVEHQGFREGVHGGQAERQAEKRSDPGKVPVDHRAQLGVAAQGAMAMATTRISISVLSGM